MSTELKTIDPHAIALYLSHVSSRLHPQFSAPVTSIVGDDIYSLVHSSVGKVKIHVQRGYRAFDAWQSNVERLTRRKNDLEQLAIRGEQSAASYDAANVSHMAEAIRKQIGEGQEELDSIIEELEALGDEPEHSNVTLTFPACPSDLFASIVKQAEQAGVAKYLKAQKAKEAKPEPAKAEPVAPVEEPEPTKRLSESTVGAQPEPAKPEPAKEDEKVDEGK